MGCNSPLLGYKASDGGFTFQYKKADCGEHMEVPCRQCVGCRIGRVREWGIRCTHEMQMHEQNCFLTLTYAPEHVPANGSLVKKHLQDFIKRFRFDTGVKLRYYACGEYGEKFQRPHYHLIVFGYDFPDKVRANRIKGNTYYNSKILEKLWPYGHSSIGEANFATASYVARYVTKKIYGDKSKDHYERINEETGEVVHLTPEFTTMSLKPGIGAPWFEKYYEDCFPSDECVIEGKKFRVPEYYFTLLERFNPCLHELMVDKRREYVRINKEEFGTGENTFERMLQKERCAIAKLENSLHRNYEKTI